MVFFRKRERDGKVLGSKRKMRRRIVVCNGMAVAFDFGFQRLVLLLLFSFYVVVVVFFNTPAFINYVVCKLILFIINVIIYVVFL